VTAHAMKGEREKCLAAGMDDYLTKPVLLEHLADLLDRWVPPANAAAAPPATVETAPRRSTRTGVIKTLASLDPARLALLFELEQKPGEPLVGRLARSFSAKAPEHLATMRDGLAAGQAEAVERAAHTLKGSAAQFGALRLSEECGAIEAFAREGDIAACE